MKLKYYRKRAVHEKAHTAPWSLRTWLHISCQTVSKLAEIEEMISEDFRWIKRKIAGKDEA